MKIVSACLAGINCAYDGKNRICDTVVELVKNGEAIPLCPEQLGGLRTPRLPTEIKNGKFINEKGEDVTNEFQKGADEAIKIAKLIQCKEAILKSHSPSCGKGIIYDGTFNHVKVHGNGIFAEKLLNMGMIVKTELEL